MTPRHALSAIALAMLALTAGCATVQPPRPPDWRLEPTTSVTHSQPSSTAYYQMGHYEAGQQRWDRAADAYRKAIAADPRNIEAYNALGVVLAQAKHYGEAETVLRNAAALDPKRAHVLSNLGNVLLLAGRPHDAVSELQTAVQLDASDRIAIDNLRLALALSRPASVQQMHTEAALSEPDSRPPEVPMPGPHVLLPATPTTATGASLSNAPTLAALPSYRIEIVNGNGIAGIAARMRGWLVERGV
jgi:tetratricopeptide (TPR) repeat protein